MKKRVAIGGLVSAVVLLFVTPVDGLMLSMLALAVCCLALAVASHEA